MDDMIVKSNMYTLHAHISHILTRCLKVSDNTNMRLNPKKFTFIIRQINS